jgi:Dockerin type I domain/PEP-CTERM motif
VIFELIRANIPGDYDGNGIVDQADYALWRQSFGSTMNLAADGNGDGVVDAADYVVWRKNVSPSAGSGAALPSANPLSASVPEPTTAILMTLGLAGWCLHQRWGPQTFLATRRRVKF